MEPTYNYKFKFCFAWTREGAVRTVSHQIWVEDIKVLYRQANAYNMIKLELAKTYGEVNWLLVKDFVKRPIMAWSLEQRLLEPVKDYIEDCKKFTNLCNTNDMPDDADLIKVEILKSTTIYEETTIDISETSEENKINKTC